MLYLIAHGPLGILDELFLLLAIGIFVAMLLAPSLNTLLKRSSESADAAPADDSMLRIESPNGKGDHYRLE